MSRHTGYNARATRLVSAMIRRFLAIVLFALSALSDLHAGTKTSADFLKIPIGAHGAALGQAYTASAEGVEAINWNPAGLAVPPAYSTMPTVGLSFTHQEHLADASLDHLGMVLPSRADRATAIGFNIIRLSYGSQDRRTADRQKVGTISSNDLALGIAAARTMGGVHIGGQFKFLSQNLAGSSARGFALDLGLRGPGPIDRMTYGLSVRNLGPRMKFVEESFHLPLTLSAGAAYRVTGPLSVLVDVHARPHQDQVNVSAGAQFAAAPSITFRAGYLARVAQSVTNTQQSETERGTTGGLYGLAAGLGLHFGQFAMDYAITPFGELGNAQTLTMASWFGGDRNAAVPGRELEVEPVPGPMSEDGRSILIIPMDHEKWWNDLR